MTLRTLYIPTRTNPETNSNKKKNPKIKTRMPEPNNFIIYTRKRRLSADLVSGLRNLDSSVHRTQWEQLKNWRGYLDYSDLKISIK